jgi:tetratricopeptide (TPR) repeat protein
MIQPLGARHARRARLYLGLGGAGFAAIAAALLLLRPSVKPYTPGLEAATGNEITSTLSRALPAGAPRVTFTDAAGPAGIHFRHFLGRRTTQLPEDMGSGAAWGDYDGDGDPDLYLVNESGPLVPHGAPRGADPAPSALYRNDGDGTFTDVTAQARVEALGMGMGAAWGDYDGDADLDLVVTRFGTNLLYRNNGDGTFTDVSATARIGAEEGFWTGAAWADYDRDGDLDLHVCGYVRYVQDDAARSKSSFQYGALLPYTLNPSSYAPERNLLFRNDGGVFREVAKQAGVDNASGRSLSASWCDFDGDGWPDLYVANDISDNAMYHNNGDGTFSDVSHAAWVADYRGAMGLGVGDWDNDGDFDIFITHWLAQENALYDNQKEKMPPTPEAPMHFIDNADMLGLGQIALDYVGWGTAFFDYDNDGRLDLLAVNGSTFQRDDDPSLLIPMKNLLFWNAGEREGFFETGAAAGVSFGKENVGRGAAFADYDGDGDVDVVINENGGPARLLQNNGGNAGGWVRLVLRGPTATISRAPGRIVRRFTTSFATGALVKITTGSVSQIREIGGGSSYLSQEPPGEVHFGVGSAATIDSTEITWPDGVKQTFLNLPARATVQITEGGQPSIVEQAPSEGRRDATVLQFWRTFNQATALRMKGEYTAAAQAYEEALSLDPRHEDSLYYLGQCLQELGRSEDARHAFTRLVEANPSSARGHLALGALHASTQETLPLDLDAAEAHLRRAHEINGEETGPMLRLGEVLIVKGKTAEALRWIGAAAATNPRSVEAAFLNGYLLWASGDQTGAREFYERAIKASKSEAPVKGVLNEGDRKADPATSSGRIAAPPLKAPMGKTLFGAFSTMATQAAAAQPDGEPRRVDLDELYRQVRLQAERLARRASPGAAHQRS